MKHYLLSLFVAAIFAATLSPANAQVPRMFSYQGVVLDGAGHFIPDGQHNIQVKLYDALNAISPIYTENQTAIVFVKGIFNVMIGSVTPIPGTVAFDKGYFLGVSVDAGTEMTPRTALSPAPYAIHASVADALDPGATGVVTSVNNQSGAVTVQAGTGAVVTNNGATITISATGTGGTGIQGVQSSDPSIVVANPTGPVASVSVGVSGITTTKIANGAVTPLKIDGTGASAGMALTANGLGGVSWVTPTGGGSLTLPFNSGISNANSAFGVTNNGTGSAGFFSASNAAGTAFALVGTSDGAANSIGLYGANTGNGRAGFIEITNANSPATAFTGKTQGTGDAIDITVNNVNNTADALHTTTNGTGRAGFFAVTSTSPSAPALEVTTVSTASSTLGFLSTILNSSASGQAIGAAAIKGDHHGTTSIGMGVWGNHSGTGTGVFGGVHGNGGYGVAGTAFGANSTAILATYSGGANGGTALELSNGYIRVSGANKTAYIHTTTAANIVLNRTTLNYAGMIPTDIVIVSITLLLLFLKAGMAFGGTEMPGRSLTRIMPSICLSVKTLMLLLSNNSYLFSPKEKFKLKKADKCIRLLFYVANYFFFLPSGAPGGIPPPAICGGGATTASGT